MLNPFICNLKYSFIAGKSSPSMATASLSFKSLLYEIGSISSFSEFDSISSIVSGK